jgi:hypothetical protein
VTRNVEGVRVKQPRVAVDDIAWGLPRRYQRAPSSIFNSTESPEDSRDRLYVTRIIRGISRSPKCDTIGVGGLASIHVDAG